MTRPAVRVTSVVLDSREPRVLAGFYERLLGWTRVANEGPRPGQPPEDGWVLLRAPDDETGLLALSFQWSPTYTPPTWPPVQGRQEMMLHLDVEVDDMDAAVVWAEACGASLADHQPQEHVRVLLDPDGHPFCLFPRDA